MDPFHANESRNILTTLSVCSWVMLTSYTAGRCQRGEWQKSVNSKGKMNTFAKETREKTTMAPVHEGCHANSSPETSSERQNSETKLCTAALKPRHAKKQLQHNWTQWFNDDKKQLWVFKVWGVLPLHIEKKKKKPLQVTYLSHYY